MKIKDYKCKCGHNNFFFADKGSQKGIYCSYCGKWLKWADKDEQNLAMKQEPILDKMRAEIESINLNEVATNYEDRFYGFQQETLAILDKYKADKEYEAKVITRGNCMMC